jgi:two-component SAPR family response regulator
MKVMIVDDQKGMLLLLQKILQKIPEISSIELFERTKDAEAYLKGNQVDLLFLDIEMPEESGIDFAKRLFENKSKIPIIFVTSHTGYALDAFGVYAFDYIVKPVSYERVSKTIHQLLQMKENISSIKEGVTLNEMFKVQTLGAFSLSTQKGEIIKFPTSKSEELFAYLIMQRGNPVSKWAVLEAIFPEMPASNAETYLNTTTYKLRKTLEPYGLKDSFVYINKNYQFVLEKIELDLLLFEDRLSELKSQETMDLKKALEVEKIFRGELFGEKGYTWAFGESELVIRKYVLFTKKIIQNCFTQKEYETAYILLKKLYSIDELDQETNLLFLRLYATKKDKVSFTKKYIEYCNKIKEELAMMPDEAFIKKYKMLEDSF